MTTPGTALPTGTVTFVFTDIEGSTRLLQELGAGYRAVQADHDDIMRAAITEESGIVVRTEGDSFFAVFPDSGAGCTRRGGRPAGAPFPLLARWGRASGEDGDPHR